jgi:hypothetical protein
MKRLWLIALAGFLAFGTAVVAEAAPFTGCGPGGTLTVPGDASPAALADGYNNNTCNLVITASITPIDSSVTFNAKSITIQGPSNPANPAGASPNVLIVNTNPASSVTLQAIDFIKIDQGSIKATNIVKISCTGVNCPIDVTASELYATTTVTTATGGGFGGPGGTLQVTSNGNTSITTSSFTGGALVKFTSNNGSVTAICQGGPAGGCQDPFGNPLSPILVQFCTVNGQLQFPCPALGNFNQNQVREICIPAGDTPLCDGGSKEKDFIAEGLIDLTGSSMTADRNMVIKSDVGPIKAAGFTLDITQGSLVMSVNNCTGTPSPCIDLKNADLNINGPVQIFVKGGCTGPGVIDTTGASIIGNNVKINACGTVCPVGVPCP